MFLSIIIPIWNDEKYLAECLDSCLNQDIPYDDYEIICVDDGSTDGSGEILRNYAENYPNIVAIKRENGGVSAARNTGLGVAKGDFVWFVDSDDMLCPNVLGNIERCLKTIKADRLVISHYNFNDKLCPEELEMIMHGEVNGIEGGDNYATQSLFSHKCIKEHNLRFDHEDITYGEDTLFVYEVKKHVLHEEKSELVSYLVRFHENSAVKNVSLEKQEAKIKSYFKVASIMKNDYDTTPYDLPMPKQFVADQIMMLSRKGLEVLAQLPWKAYKKSLHELKEKGLYPVKQLKESTYTVKECANEPSGTSKLRNIFRFYSINRIGLFLAALPYRIQRLKIKASRALRKNKMMNKLLDFKNKLLRR